MRLSGEGEGARPLRLLHVPVDVERLGQAGITLLFDIPEATNLAEGANVQALLDILPIGLALVDRDGRFLTTNKAFRAAGGNVTEYSAGRDHAIASGVIEMHECGGFIMWTAGAQPE